MKKELTLKEKWVKSYKKVNAKNWELTVRKLAEYNPEAYAHEYFKPEDLAYIRWMIKEYIVNWVGPLVKELVERKHK